MKPTEIIAALEKVREALRVSLCHAAGVGIEAYSPDVQRQCNEALALVPNIIEAVRGMERELIGREMNGLVIDAIHDTILETINKEAIKTMTAVEMDRCADAVFAKIRSMVDVCKKSDGIQGQLPKPPAAGSE
jgi:hypothetical protein